MNYFSNCLVSALLSGTAEDVFVERLIKNFADTLALHSAFQFREDDKITLSLTRKKIEAFNEQYIYNVIDSFRILSSYPKHLDYLVEYPAVPNILCVLVSDIERAAFKLRGAEAIECL